MQCKLVDVFAKERLSGNGLTIFYDCESLDEREMLSLTQEMRQFESIFISQHLSQSSVKARIFTLEEELDFAGHPVIGLAAHLHEESGDPNTREWIIELNTKSVCVKTERTKNYFKASMSQGRPSFIKTLSDEESKQAILSVGLQEENLCQYPLEVISTGLPYLIIPIVRGIETTKISTSHFEDFLLRLGAKFVYVFDMLNFEGRTWNNDGTTEDIATGSAAGPIAAYLHKHRLCMANTPLIISQGRFTGRPSEIEAYIESEGEEISTIWVSGDVIHVANILFT